MSLNPTPAYQLVSQTIVVPTGSVQFKWDYSDLPDDVRMTIRSYVMQIKDCSRKIVQHAITVGNALIAVKGRLKHGDFTAWYKAEFNMSQQTAERLMHLAVEAPKINNVVDFGLSIFYQLTAPQLDPEVRESATHELEIIAANGEKITNAIASNTIQAFKNHAEKMKAALDKATPAVLEVTERFKITEPRTVEALIRLQESAKKDGSTNTFDEIQRTGLIQPTDDNAKPVSIAAEYPYIDAVLKQKSKDHAVVGSSVVSGKRVKVFDGNAVVTDTDHNFITLRLDRLPELVGNGQCVRVILYDAPERAI